MRVGQKKADGTEMNHREEELPGGGRREEWEAGWMGNGERTFKVYALLLPERSAHVLDLGGKPTHHVLCSETLVPRGTRLVRREGMPGCDGSGNGLYERLALPEVLEEEEGREMK